MLLLEMLVCCPVTASVVDNKKSVQNSSQTLLSGGSNQLDNAKQ
jgi:hypothetical protein